jgi:MOSC domain-containing protein YiiM
VVSVPSAEMEPVHGMVGDRYRSATTGKRQVTLIGALDLVAIAQALGLDSVAPELLRRNVAVSGINLHALHGRCFQLGEAVLEATGDCHPCSRMEEIFGPGGYNAVRGHGGITARVITPGMVRLGDAISRSP